MHTPVFGRIYVANVDVWIDQTHVWSMSPMHYMLSKFNSILEASFLTSCWRMAVACSLVSTCSCSCLDTTIACLRTIWSCPPISCSKSANFWLGFWLMDGFKLVISACSSSCLTAFTTCCRATWPISPICCSNSTSFFLGFQLVGWHSISRDLVCSYDGNWINHID